MQKIKNPILCWIVILAVFIRPTPAQAMVPLAVVAVGAVIAATGVMVAGAGVYKPPTFAQANAAVDSVTGDITRKVVVARAFSSGVSSGMRGYYGQYTLDFDKVAEWVNSHTPDFPALSGPVSSATVPGSLSPSVGQNYSTPSGIEKIIGISFQERSEMGTYDDPATGVSFWGTTCIDIGGGRWINSSHNAMLSDFVFNRLDGTIRRYMVTYTQFTMAPTTDEVTPVPPSTYNPSAFAAAYPNTEAGQDDTDRIAAQNPSAVKIAPQPFTPDQIKEAAKQGAKEALEAQATTLESQALVDPTNTALQIAAQQARAAADQAAIEAEAAKAEVEITPEEEAKTDTPPPAGPAPDADLAIDFSPFLGLQDKAMSKFPFSLVSSLGSLFSGLTSAPVTPSMDVPMPWGMAPKQITLSHWDDFAGKWRMMIALFFHASCIYAIIRRYS